jgi:hypothetical protein
MRTMIRFPINGESDSKLRNGPARILAYDEFIGIGTASFEGSNIS